MMGSILLTIIGCKWLDFGCKWLDFNKSPDSYGCDNDMTIRCPQYMEESKSHIQMNHGYISIESKAWNGFSFTQLTFNVLLVLSGTLGLEKLFNTWLTNGPR